MATTAKTAPTRRDPTDHHGRDRSLAACLWYRVVQCVVTVILSAFFSLRATGRRNMPKSGAALLVSNHLSHLDVFVIGILLQRPLNYVARSTLFVPGVGDFIRSVGGFPIQREGLGASGMKETLRRLRVGGIVALFPEGTRSPDGELGEVKGGIALLGSRAKVPIVPAAVAGTFEAWPRACFLPAPSPLRVHFGPAIYPDALAILDGETATRMIRERMLDSQRAARAGLAGDLGDGEKRARIGVGEPGGLG